LEDRTEVVRFEDIHPLVPGDPMYMDVDVPIKFAFPADSDAAAGKDVIETLGALYNFVVSDVIEPLDAFLS
jgi:hypothetical protein